jgi:hypothetical protein
MWVFKTLHTSHVVIISSHVYRNQAILNYYNEAQPPLVVVKHPWSDPVNRAFYTGVPPYTCLLQDLAFIKNQQVLLLESFVNKVKEALIECGVTGTRMTAERLQNLFDQFRNELTQHLSGIRPIRQSATVHVQEVKREETGRGYTLHVYGGRCTVFHKIGAHQDVVFSHYGVSGGLVTLSVKFHLFGFSRQKISSILMILACQPRKCIIVRVHFVNQEERH